MGYCLGVDLGTTFTAAAVACDERVEMVSLGDRSVVMPSAVCVRDDGQLITGDAAARRAVSNPDRVASEIKRRLGDPTPLLLGGSAYLVTDLLATLLRDVLTTVSAEHHGPPDEVMLTHPANWGPYRRELFEEVPGSAGVEKWSIITEPEAAAAYYAATREMTKGEVIAVYDLGGGTFDATVLGRTEAGIDVLGTPEGIERLGGADLDDAVLSFVNHAAGGALAELDLGDASTVVALARLRQDCILAKEALSLDTETVIPVFLPGRHLDVALSRSQFEDLIRAEVDSTIGTLSRTLRSAGIAPSRLSAVLLVGGSSQIPLVARMIGQQLGCPTVIDAHPKHPVALGAAAVARGTGSLPGPGQAEAGGEGRAASGVVSPVDAADRAADRGEGAAPDAPPNGRPADRASGPRDGRSPGSVPPSAGAPPGAATPPDGGQSGPPGPPAPREPVDGGGRPLPAAVPGRARGSPKVRGRPLTLLGVLCAVAIAVLVVVLVGAHLGTDGGAPSAPPTGVSSPSVADAPVVPSAAPAVPIPSLGTAIPVGPTPTFVVATPNGRQLYVTNGAAGTITVVDMAVNKVTATIQVPAGPPQYLAFSPDGKRIYVSVFNEARTVTALCVVDATRNAVIKTIPMASRPFVPAVTPDGSRVYVPNHDTGNIAVIDTRTDDKITDIAVPKNPHWVSFTPDGKRAYVADHESNLVSVVDTATNAVVATVSVGTSPHSVAVHPTRPLVANVNYDSATVTMIDSNTNRVVATIPVGKAPQHVVWSADGRFAYVADVDDDAVSVIDAATFTVTATIPTGAGPTSIAVLPDGKTAYVTDHDAGTLTVLNVGS